MGNEFLSLDLWSYLLVKIFVSLTQEGNQDFS